MIKKVGTVVVLVIATLFAGGPNVWAAGETELAACLAEVPGAVAAEAVTPENDVVCLGGDDVRWPSAGDDKYFWVGEEGEGGWVGPSTLPTGYPSFDDPGSDTLSLSRWSTAWPANTPLFANRVGFDVENIDFTAFNDNFGDPSACGFLTSNNGITFNGLAGDDTIQCVTGTILGGEGADTVIGVTLGTTVQAGPGEDFVQGDIDADLIQLGGGNDTAQVVKGGIDNVDGGLGTDQVWASSNDILVSAMRMTVEASTPVRVAVQKAHVQHVAINKAKITFNNKASKFGANFRVKMPRGVKVFHVAARKARTEVVKAQSVIVRSHGVVLASRVLSNDGL